MNQLGLIRNAPLTIALIVLCVGLYIPDLMGFHLSSYMAVRAGGMASAPWTLVTAMFAHGGIEHLAFNMISLWYMGSLLENMQGTPRFAIVYFLSGIAGNVAFSLFGTGAAVGASGAIFGLLGACALLLFATRDNPAAKSMLNGMAGMLVINVLNSFMPGIAMEAHFGGLIVGLIVEALFLFTPLGTALPSDGRVDGRTDAAASPPIESAYDGPYRAEGASGMPDGRESPDAALGEGASGEGNRPAADVPVASGAVDPAGAFEAPRSATCRLASTVAAIAASLVVTALAFGALAFSYFGIDFSSARVIGSAQTRAADARSSIQWAGDELTGFVQVPNDWVVDPVRWTDGAYMLSYQTPSDASAGGSLNVSVARGTAADAARLYLGDEGDPEAADVGSREALRCRREEGGKNLVAYFIDLGQIYIGGGSGSARFEFVFDGDEPEWVSKSVAAYELADSGGASFADLAAGSFEASGFAASETQWAGSEQFGYLQVPGSWHLVPSEEEADGMVYYDVDGYELDGDSLVSTLSLFETPYGFPDVEAALRNAYSGEDIVVEHVIVNGTDAHLVTVTVSEGGSEVTDVICHIDGQSPSGESVIVEVSYAGSAKGAYDDLLATYVRAKG